MDFGCEGQMFFEEYNKAFFLEITNIITVIHCNHFYAGIDKNSGEDVEHPIEMMDDGCAGHDDDTA